MNISAMPVDGYEGAAIHPSARVHPTALVDPDSVVEAGADLGPGAIVGAGSRVGPGCRIGPRAQIGPGAVLGEGCVVDTGVVVGAPAGPQAAGPLPEPVVSLGGDCHVGEYSLVLGEPGQPTWVDDGAYIMAWCLVEPGAALGRGLILTNHAVVHRGARLGDHVVVGGFTLIGGGVHVGQRTMVGAFSTVEVDVPPFVLASGVPARVYDINRVGLRRSGVALTTREALHRVVRLLLKSSLGLEELLQQLGPDLLAHPEVRELVDFVAGRPQLLGSWRQRGEEQPENVDE